MRRVEMLMLNVILFVDIVLLVVVDVLFLVVVVVCYKCDGLVLVVAIAQ